MTEENLLIPREMIARHLVTPEKMEQLLDLARQVAENLAGQFPDAIFSLDTDDVLRVIATEQDAAEVDYLLREMLPGFVPHVVTRRQ